MSTNMDWCLAPTFVFVPALEQKEKKKQENRNVGPCIDLLKYSSQIPFFIYAKLWWAVSWILALKQAYVI